MQRNFRPQAPDRLFVADITAHRTAQGWYYLAVVLDCFSRPRHRLGDGRPPARRAGRRCACRWRSGTVAPGRARSTISDHGSQTGLNRWSQHRLRDAGPLGSMGTIGDCFDNSVAESFFATLQSEVLDGRSWRSRDELGSAVFAYIEGFYNARRRHSTLEYLSPIDYELQHQAGRLSEPAA